MAFDFNRMVSRGFSTGMNRKVLMVLLGLGALLSLGYNPIGSITMFQQNIPGTSFALGGALQVLLFVWFIILVKKGRL